MAIAQGDTTEFLSCDVLSQKGYVVSEHQRGPEKEVSQGHPVQEGNDSACDTPNTFWRRSQSREQPASSSCNSHRFKV